MQYMFLFKSLVMVMPRYLIFSALSRTVQSKEALIEKELGERVSGSLKIMHKSPPAPLKYFLVLPTIILLLLPSLTTGPGR